MVLSHSISYQITMERQRKELHSASNCTLKIGLTIQEKVNNFTGKILLL